METKNFYTELLRSTNTLAEDLSLDEFSAMKLRDHVLAVAKEEYKAGNRSGIRWAWMNPVPCDLDHKE